MFIIYSKNLPVRYWGIVISVINNSKKTARVLMQRIFICEGMILRTAPLPTLSLTVKINFFSPLDSLGRWCTLRLKSLLRIFILIKEGDTNEAK
jgi:hypothetical protein